MLVVVAAHLTQLDYSLAKLLTAPQLAAKHTTTHHALILNSILFAVGTHLVRQRVSVCTDDDPSDDIVINQ